MKPSELETGPTTLTRMWNNVDFLTGTHDAEVGAGIVFCRMVWSNEKDNSVLTDICWFGCLLFPSELRIQISENFLIMYLHLLTKKLQHRNKPLQRLRNRGVMSFSIIGVKIRQWK
jgi:hypothetical protein